MTRHATVDLVESWLSDGPYVAPDRLRNLVAAEVARTPQDRGSAWGSRAMLVPVGIALLLAVALAFQVLRPNVGDAPEANGSSTLLRDWPGQPDWFVERDIVPFCGESHTGPVFDPSDDHDADGRQCLLEAYRTGGSGEFVTVAELDDDRLLTVTRVLRGRVELISNRSMRGGATRPWHRFECTQLADPGQLAEEMGRSISRQQAAAMVFEVDQRSCSSASESDASSRVSAAHELAVSDRLGAYMFESIWLMNAESGTLKRVDPYSGSILSEANLGEWLVGEPDPLMAVGPASLWLAAGSELIEIDPQTGGAAARVTLDGPVSDLVVDGDLVWATVGGEQVIGVSVFEHSVAHRITLAGAAGVTADGAWIWANSAEGNGVLLQIDPWTGSTVAEHRIGSGVHRLLFFGGALYGLPDPSSTTRVISAVRYDPDAADLLRLPLDGEGPATMTSFLGELWGGYPGGRIARLDPSSLDVVGQLRIGGAGEDVLDVLSGDASLWAMGYRRDGATLYRIEPAAAP